MSMAAPTSLALTAYYSKEDWQGYVHVKWTSPTQPVDHPFYRVEYHDIESSSWIWLDDVPQGEGDDYGISVQFATAPPGGTPKSRTVDTVRITAMDADGVQASANATISTPADLSVSHVAATNLDIVCEGVISGSDGFVNLAWEDLSKFISTGRIILTKYGKTSPGIQRVLYDKSFNGTSSDYGPNRVRIPLELLEPGYHTDPSLQNAEDFDWDINNPENERAPYWVVEGDILTLKLVTNVDGDEDAVVSEFSFNYYHQIAIQPVITNPIKDIPFSKTLVISGDAYVPIPIDGTIAYISGLPTGLSYNAGTREISGTPTTVGSYTAIFTATSKGNWVHYQALPLDVVSDFASLWPVITCPPQEVVLIRGVHVPRKWMLQGTGGDGGGTAGYTVVSGTLPAGIALDGDTGLFVGSPTAIEAPHTVVFKQLSTGVNYSVSFSVIQGATPTVITLQATASNLFQIGVCTFDFATDFVTSPAHGLSNGNKVKFTGGILPDELSFDSNYFVVNKTENTFQISLTQGGDVIDFSDNGTGNHMLVVDISDVILADGTMPVYLGRAAAYRVVTDIPAMDYRAFDLPANLFLIFTGVLTGIPDDAVGEYPAYVQAKNEWGWGPLTKIVVSVVPPTPVITSPLSIDVFINEPFAYFTLANYEPVFFGADGLPDGFTINPATGKITGVATEVGEFQVSLTAVNRGGAGIAVLSMNLRYPDVPVIDQSALIGRALTLQANEAFVFQPSATNNPTRWSITPDTQGLSFDSLTGRLSGRFQSNGFYSITFVAYNSGGASEPVTFYFIVGAQETIEGAPPPVPRVPIDVVDLWVDLETGLVSVGSAGESAAETTVKRGDSTIINVIFHKQGTPTELAITGLYFGAKVKFDDDYVVYSTEFRRLDVGRYRTYPDFSDQNNELDQVLQAEQVKLITEIQWDVSTLIRRSSQTFNLVVLRDLLHPDPSLTSIT